MKYYLYELMNEYLSELKRAIGSKTVCIWGMTENGFAMASEALKKGYKVICADSNKHGDNFIINMKDYEVLLPEETFSDAPFYIITGEKAWVEIEEILKSNQIYGFSSFFRWLDDKEENDIELIRRRKREYLNLTKTLLGIQNYQSDLIVDGIYRNVAPITTTIGCPVKCRYCPQRNFVEAYMSRPNPIQMLEMNTFKKFLGKMSKDVIISFTGMVEPFANPKTLDMILYAMEKGHMVRVFSTMYNQTIESYKTFKDHPNLKTFDLHVPDCQGNTQFSITDRYLELVRYIFNNPPKYGKLWTSCLGVDGGIHEKLKSIINVNPNPINSIHGLVYNNHVNHGDAKLSCKYDCGRLDNPNAGVGMLFPNGDVTGCTQDWELKHIIGNIHEVDSWEELMRSPQRKEFINSLEDSKITSICRTCELAIEIDASDIN